MSTDQKLFDVFISHSSHDAKIAQAVCAKLEQDDLRCWMAPRDVPAGSKWMDSIMTAIENSKAMVVILSSQANISDQVQREVSNAVDSGLTVIPFRLSEFELSKSMRFLLKDRHWLDAMTPPLEQSIVRLSDEVHKVLGMQPPPPPPPPPLPSRKFLVPVVAVLSLVILALGLIWIFRIPTGQESTPAVSEQARAASAIESPIKSNTLQVPVENIDPEEFNLLMERGREEYLKSNASKADAFFSQSIKIGTAYAESDPNASVRWARFVAEPWRMRAANSGYVDGNWNKAREQTMKAVDFARKSGEHAAALEILSNSLRQWADVEARLGNRAAFNSIMPEALVVAEKVSPTHVVDTHSLWASHFVDASNREDARDHCKKAIQILEDILSKSPSDAWASQRLGEVKALLARL